MKHRHRNPAENIAALFSLFLFLLLPGCSEKPAYLLLPQAQTSSRITEIAHLSGKKVGIVTGSVYDQALNSKNPLAIPEYFNSFSDQVEALKSGKIDAFLVDEPMARDMMLRTGGLKTLKDLLTSDGYAFAFSKKRAHLQKEVNAALREMKANGTLQKIDARWFGSHEAAKTLPDFRQNGKNGRIRLATNGNLAPFAYMKHGKIIGYDIEIAMRIAEKLDRTLEISDMDCAAILPSLVSGKSDMAVGGITVTQERAKSVLFSDFNYEGGIAVMVRAENAVLEYDGLYDFWNSITFSFYRTFIDENRYQLILQGLKVTLMISFFSTVFGVGLGLGICGLRRSRNRWANLPARIYIRTIQGTPIIVLLMILYYIVFGSIDIGAIPVGIIGFSLNFSAYVSEMMRSAMDTVDEGQKEAAYAIGFTRVQVFQKIVFPQAVRYVLPVFKGEVISMIKMTSVVGYIAIQDLTRMSDIIRSRTYEAFFPLVATALIYFGIAYAIAHLISLLEISMDPKQRKRVLKTE
ncbi:MAG TPA: ABC transporter substrate-binding protein/permease [Smithellaceae bacterium]|nr:ABC transporter substrate-binding protein/permease [Smithellaceae bacterium]HQM45310.1 ABC transporter substrate-binding protein/permease [Smithellaceae bacterium]